MIRDLVRLALAGLVILALGAAYASFRIWQQGQSDERRPAGAVVALGAAEYDGTPSPVLAARLDHAIDLFRTGNYRYLVVTGGKADGDRMTEAAAARAYALSKGMRPQEILWEDRGRTTLESLTGVATVLRDHGIGDAVFVSDRTHMLRVLRMAEDLGIVAWGSPTTSSPTDAIPSRTLGAYAHELAGLAEYFVFHDAPAGELAARP